MSRRPPLGTGLYLAVCLLMFGWCTLAGGSTSTPVLYRFGAAWPPAILGGEWWRLVGPMFLHIGPVHLAVNMYSLWAIGPPLELFMGTVPFLALTCLAGLGGSAGSLLLGADRLSAGLSGALFGLFGAYIWLGMRGNVPNWKRRLLPILGLNLALGFSIPGIDNAAHLGGLLCGFLAMAALASVPRALLLALAALPFLVEGVVVWHAVRMPDLAQAPTRQLEVSGGVRLRVPELFRPAPSDRANMQLLKIPGINLVIVVADQPVAAPLGFSDPVKAAQAWAGGAVQVSSQEVVEQAGLQWLLITGQLKDAQGCFGVLSLPGHQVAIGALSDQLAGARAVVLPVLASLQPPSPGWLPLQKAALAWESHDGPGALTALDEAVQADPRLGEAFLYRSMVYVDLGQAGKASEDADRAVQLLDSPEALLQRATIRIDQKRPDEARADLDRAAPQVDARLKPWLTRLRKALGK